MEGHVNMDLFKIFFEKDIPAGLSTFRDMKEDTYSKYRVRTDYRKQYFKPNYSNNFFLL